MDAPPARPPDPVRDEHSRHHNDATYDQGDILLRIILGGDHDIGMGREPREAIRGALGALGERYAREMARYAELEAGPSAP